MQAGLGKSLLSMAELDRASLEGLLLLATDYKSAGNVAPSDHLCAGKIVACLFQEPSIRTKLSFEAASIKMGCHVLGNAGLEGSRSNSTYSESLQDVALIMSAYADLIILRHPSTAAVQLFAEHATVPVINAGSGQGPGSEHPTQALVDLFTIKERCGKLDGLTVLLMGCLVKRAARSLVFALSLFSGVRLHLYAPPGMSLPQEDIVRLREAGVNVTHCASLALAIEEADVVYHAGQAGDAQEQLSEDYILTSSVCATCKPSSIIIHPMPRPGSITVDVDHLTQASYFENASNAVPVRMAIIGRTWTRMSHA